MNTDPKYFALDISQPGAVRPELLAKKIADARSLALAEFASYCEKQPRTFEALWFLQWVSVQPGGIPDFVTKLVEFMEPRLGTESARKFGQRKYTRAECAQVLKELPRRQRVEAAFGDVTYDELAAQEGVHTAHQGGEISDSDYRAACEKLEVDNQNRIEQEAYERNAPFFRQICVNAACKELPGFLLSLCVGDAENPSRWYCPDVIAEILNYMDRHAEQMKSRLAMTVVAEKVFDALDYASSERVMVRCSGDSRFGKSESVETWAAMWPGRGRVVGTPSSNSERDLIRAIAEAFGLHQTYGSRGETLRAKVEYVLRFSGLMMIFDEGAWLVPSSFSATTPPARLNWIRAAIVNRKIPCAIITTPQSYEGAMSRFVKKTGYNLAQFIGRESMCVDLPNELSHKDLLAVARVHFPDADGDLLALIAAKAMQSESYLKAVENVAKRARYNTKKRGATKLTLPDVEKAIAEVMPPTAPAVFAAPSPQRGRSHAARVRAPEKATAAAFRNNQAERISSVTGRSVTPVKNEEEAVAAG